MDKNGPQPLVKRCTAINDPPRHFLSAELRSQLVLDRCGGLFNVYDLNTAGKVPEEHVNNAL
jgi:hypothetical protein